MVEIYETYDGETKVTIHHKYQTVETLFWDGSKTIAAPQKNAEYEDKAKSLGYNNGWEMCEEHDLLHVKLVEALGLPYSPSLYNAANDIEPSEVDWEEENMVLAAQKFLNAWRRQAHNNE